MKLRALIALFSVAAFACICHAQSSSALYRPLGATQATEFQQWEALRQTMKAPTASERRPVLPGVSGHNLELLQDAVARKFPHVTEGRSLPVARKVISQTTQSSLPKLRGYMAEAMYLDKNPEWKYVKSPNASQHDVFANRPDGGRGTQTGQVKFHIDGDPKVYARDMIRDNRSGRFLVPDDHVDRLRAHLKVEADKLKAGGDTAGAEARYRDMNRVKGIGATSTQIDRATRQAIAEARVTRVAPYVTISVASALLIAPTLWDWSQGEIDADQALYRLTKGGSSVLAGIATDQALKRWKGGLLRGTVRGNMIVASVVLIVDSTWQVYEFGGVGNALQSPDFIINLGGGISAASCALAGGWAGGIGGAKLGGAIGALFGPEGVPVGAAWGSFVGGFAGGTTAGAAGYFGGSKGTRWVMETFCPDKLYQQEHLYVRNVQEGVETSIVSLQTM